MVKASVYKSSTSSIQNAVLMLLFVIGMFMMYRYVKTIETETKLLQNHMIELSQKLQGVVSNQEDCRAHLATMSESGSGGMMMMGGGGACPMPQRASGGNEMELSGTEEEGGEYEEDGADGDEDNQSVQSGEITEILRQVIGSAMDITDQLPSAEDARQMKCSLEQIDEVEDGGVAETRSEATTAVTESAKVVMNIDDDIGEDEPNGEEESEFTEEKLLKRTNEDLKAICREMDLSTKGTKADLVARIMQS